MQSKLERDWLKEFSLASLAVVAFGIYSFLGEHSVQAQITTPTPTTSASPSASTSPYSVSTTTPTAYGNFPTPGPTEEFYTAVQTLTFPAPTPSTNFTDEILAPGYAQPDVTQKWQNNQVAQTFYNSLQFQVYNQAPANTSGNATYLVLSVAAAQNHLIPIGFCQQNGNNCFNLVPGLSPNPQVGIQAFEITPGGSDTIGIYLDDICEAVLAGAGTSPIGPCSTAGGSGHYVVPNVGGAVDNFIPLTFNFVTAPYPLATNIPLPVTGSLATLQVDIHPEGDNFPVSCVPAANFNQYYQPGDQQITVTVSPPNSTVNLISQNITGHSGAPPFQVVGVASPESNGALPYGPSFYSGNSVIGSGPNSGFGIQIFQNSTVASGTGAVPYYVGFGQLDYAGLLTYGTGAGFGANCQYPGVETVAISGFLKKSSCFIATAAFRSIDSMPVAMLRHFRDQVLLHSSAGRSFVSWYYNWSPPAAEWLMRNPTFRFPVLTALVPLEIFAYLILNPILGMILLAGSLVTVGVVFRKERATC